MIEESALPSNRDDEASMPRNAVDLPNTPGAKNSHVHIYIYFLIESLPNAELIIQKNGYAYAMDIDGMLCQYGGLSNTFDLSRWAYRCPGSGA